MGNIYDNWENLDDKTKEKCEKVMNKYGLNKWWESEDPLQVALYQIFEPTLLVDFSLFHQGLEELLDRPVFTHELGLNYEGLKREAELSIERFQKGINKISDEQREEFIKRSIGMLEDYCKKNNKRLLKINLNDKEPDKTENGIDMSGYDGPPQ